MRGPNRRGKWRREARTSVEKRDEEDENCRGEGGWGRGSVFSKSIGNAFCESALWLSNGSHFRKRVFRTLRIASPGSKFQFQLRQVLNYDDSETSDICQSPGIQQSWLSKPNTHLNSHGLFNFQILLIYLFGWHFSLKHIKDYNKTVDY